MQTLKITPEFAAIVASFVEAGKTPWLIINDDYAVGAYENRTAARNAKSVEKLAGSIVKASEVSVEVVELKPAKAKPEIVRASTIESPCWVVWDTADKMKGERRKDIIAACIAKGVAYYTARTQYQLWLTANKNAGTI